MPNDPESHLTPTSRVDSTPLEPRRWLSGVGILAVVALCCGAVLAGFLSTVPQPTTPNSLTSAEIASLTYDRQMKGTGLSHCPRAFF